MSKIVRLEVDNIMRVRSLFIEPDPNDPVVVIRGDNAEGKTSVLTAIALAIGGKKIQPPNVIHEGQIEARVLLDTDDYVIERKWSSNTESVVEVRSKEEGKLKSPQKILDAMISRLSFDPLQFMELDEAPQADALRKVVGLDFAKLDGHRLKAYDDRTEANKALAALEARVKAFPVEKERLERVEVAELLEQQRALNAKISARAAAEQRTITASAAVATATTAVREAEAALGRALGRLSEAKAASATAFDAFNACEAVPVEQLTELGGKISTASDHNERVRKQGERDHLVLATAEALEKVEKLNAAIAAIDSEKAALTAAAAFPVPGLGFGPGGVTLNGFPLKQASGAEKLKVSVGIGLALNPELKVLLVRDGSLLDGKSRKLLAELAAAAGAQVWLEVVGKEGAGIVIEDGEVAGQNTLFPKVH